MDEKPWLVCDNDDVLHIFGPGLYDFHNKRYNTNYTEEDMWSYDLSIAWGCSKEEVLRRVEEYYHSEEHWNAEPVEGAVEILTKLAPFYRFAVVTAKPDWLRDRQMQYHNQHFSDLIEIVEFTNQYHGSRKSRTKLEVCRGFQPVAVVEDNLDNANQIAGGGIKVFLLNKIWNQGQIHEYVVRVPNWHTIGELLLKK